MKTGFSTIDVELSESRLRPSQTEELLDLTGKIGFVIRPYLIDQKILQ